MLKNIYELGSFQFGKSPENKNLPVMRINHERTNEARVIQRCKKKKKSVCLREAELEDWKGPDCDRQTDRVSDSQTGTLTNGPWEKT